VNPPNPWTQLGNLAPGIITALSALVAVWLTQRHQLRLEFHKAELAAKYKSQDNRWAFKKDLYVDLIKTTHDILKNLHNMAYAITLKNAPEESLRNLARQMFETDVPHFQASIKDLTTYAALAPLATADDVLPLLTAAADQVFREVNVNAPDATDRIQGQLKALRALLNELQAAGRNDLWGDSELKAKANSGDAVGASAKVPKAM
jgi:hypothetical protein